MAESIATSRTSWSRVRYRVNATPFPARVDCIAPALRSGTASRMTWSRNCVPTSNGGGSGSFSGIANGVPSGKKPRARRKPILPIASRSRSISSSVKPQEYGRSAAARPSIQLSKCRSCCWKCCCLRNNPSDQTMRLLSDMVRAPSVFDDERHGVFIDAHCYSTLVEHIFELLLRRPRNCAPPGDPDVAIGGNNCDKARVAVEWQIELPVLAGCEHIFLARDQAGAQGLLFLFVHAEEIRGVELTVVAQLVDPHDNRRRPARGIRIHIRADDELRLGRSRLGR